MLGLLHPTDPAWLEVVEGDLDTMLQDHAQCELKAAHSALSVVGRYGAEAPEFIEPLLALAREEAEHVGAVSQRLAARNTPMGQPGSDTYVTLLTRAARQNHHDGFPPLLDRLLVAALVEGRSCERFRVLAEGLGDGELRAFYRDLMASEARHFRLFTQLADNRFGPQTTKQRFMTLAEREAGIAATLPLGPQVHG